MLRFEPSIIATVFAIVVQGHAAPLVPRQSSNDTAPVSDLSAIDVQVRIAVILDDDSCAVVSPTVLPSYDARTEKRTVMVGTVVKDSGRGNSWQGPDGTDLENYAGMAHTIRSIIRVFMANLSTTYRLQHLHSTTRKILDARRCSIAANRETSRLLLHQRSALAECRWIFVLLVRRRGQLGYPALQLAIARELVLAVHPEHHGRQLGRSSSQCAEQLLDPEPLCERALCIWQRPRLRTGWHREHANQLWPV